MPTRRETLSFALASVVISKCGWAACTQEPLQAAIERAGGERALKSVKSLRWQGTARIFAAERIVEIGVATEVMPFASARSDSWLLADGPEKKRSLFLDGEQGWSVRNGQRSPMPEAMRVHEQQQFAIYGLMLLVGVCAVRSPTAHADYPGLTAVAVEHRSAPPTTLYFDAAHRLAAASNRVTDPEDITKSIPQRFEFVGEMVVRGVPWPRIIRIRQNDAPYFELTLNELIIARH
jgi:hypothetical protein